MAHQRGILDPPQQHAVLMTFDLEDASAAPGRLRFPWEDVSERLHDWYASYRLTVTVGFGLPLFEKLGRAAARPPALKAMPGWEGDDFDPAATQADLVVQVCGDDRAVVHNAERDVRRHLAPAFAVRDYEVGFGMPGSRGVLGFVDGTGNPHGDARIPVVLIGDEDPAHRDGSYMVLRKIREDLAAWERLEVGQQERVIGRRKADSAPFDPAASTPPTSHKEKSTVETPDGEVEILRRSFPFGGRDEAGLLFVCWVRDLAQYETIKGQMAGARNVDGTEPGRDAIEEFYTAVSGGYYYVPPEPEGDGYLGDFLFE